MQEISLSIKIDFPGKNEVEKLFTEIGKQHEVKLEADFGNIDASIKRTSQSIGSYFERVKAEIAQVGFVIQGITNIANVVDRYIGGMVREAIEAEQGLIKINAALISTNYASGWSAEGLKANAEQLERIANVDADEILNSVTAPLLTFKNISGSILSETQLAVLNVKKLLGNDLKGTAIQLGKALNDPIQGLSALTRVGISFTAEQKEMIKSMAEMGNVAGAQKLIIEELNAEFRGQAEAAAKSYAGRLAAFNIAVNNLKESLGKLLLPVLSSIASPLKVMVDWFSSLSGSMKGLTVTIPILTILWYKYQVAMVAGTVTSMGLAGAITAAATAVKGFVSTLGPVGLIMILIGLLAQLVENTIGWANVWIYVKEYAVAAVSIVWNYLKAFGTFAFNFSMGMQKVLSLPFKVMYESAVAIFSNLATIMKKLMSGDFAGVWQAIKTGVGKSVTSAVDDVSDSFGKAMDSFDGLGKQAAATWKTAGANAKKAIEAANTTTTTVPSGTIAEDSTASPNEGDTTAVDEKLEAERKYYEEVKFLDAGYYNWKLGQIKAELDALNEKKLITQEQYDLLKKTREEELTAARDKPVNDLIEKYKTLLSTMADSKTIGVQTWKGILEGLTALRDEMLEFKDDAKVAEVIASLNEKISIAAMNAGKKQNGWFWGHLLGLDSEGDREIINAAQATYQNLMNGISDITNTMISQNNTRRQKELSRIDEVAKREKWSAERVAEEKARINEKFEAKERKLKEIQRKMSIVQATINTSVAVTKALEMGPILGPIFAGIIGAMGAVQISLIKAQKFAGGGLFRGKGGPKDDSNLVAISDSEYIVNAAATRKWLPLLEMINSGNGLDGRNGLNGRYGQVGFAEGGSGRNAGDIGKLIKTALSEMTIVIDARNPDPKTWAKMVKLGDKELKTVTL